MNENSVFKDRRSKRQKVLLKSQIEVGSYYFETLVFDLSLRGARIKLNLPIATGENFTISIKNDKEIPSKVCWFKDGFIGLKFEYTPERVRKIFGTLGEKLD